MTCIATMLMAWVCLMYYSVTIIIIIVHVYLWHMYTQELISLILYQLLISLFVVTQRGLANNIHDKVIIKLITSYGKVYLVEYK